MKKLILALALPLFFVLALPLSATAQTGTADNDDIQRSLEERSLDKAPGVVEVEESKLLGAPPSSGFVDENGNPISDEEYARIRAENKKSIFAKQPVLTAVIVLAIIGGVVFLLKKKKQ